MIWLYILLGFILILALIMLIPIKIFAAYNEEFSCCIAFGFVKLQLYPENQKKPKKPKTKKALKKKKSESKPETEKKKSNIIKEKGFSWLLELIKKVASLASSVLKDFFAHILIKKLSLSISVAGSDAAETAIKYGKCCSVVYPAISIIASSMICSKYGVDIVPNFEENAKTKAEFDFIARVFAFRIVELVLKHGFKALKILLELKN